jgi:hypothetical protein
MVFLTCVKFWVGRIRVWIGILLMPISIRIGIKMEIRIRIGIRTMPIPDNAYKATKILKGVCEFQKNIDLAFFVW